MKAAGRKGSNLSCAGEKIASDFHYIVCEGSYKVPKMKLAYEEIESEFFQSKLEAGDNDINKSIKPTQLKFSTVYIMSKILEGYIDLKDSKVEDPKKLGTEIDIQYFVKKSETLPEYILYEGRKMEILGLMNILAISKLISDTDCLGGDLSNVGFKIISDHQVIAVKVDMGSSFNDSYDTNQLKALELYLMEIELIRFRNL
jgi:hypothetical protein